MCLGGRGPENIKEVITFKTAGGEMIFDMLRDLFLIVVGSYLIGAKLGLEVGFGVFFVAAAVNNFKKYTKD